MVDRVRVGTETPRSGPRRTSIGCPHRLAVAIDGNTVGAAPWSSFYMRPITHHAIGIGTAVDRLNLVRLRSTSACLRLETASAQRNQSDDDRGGQPESS